MLGRGVSLSRAGIFCRASIVADEGGVFSPRIDLVADLVEGLRPGVSFRKSRLAGVGVSARVGLRSGELEK